MNSILIADDERIEREGIKLLLKHYNYQFDIKEAVNGKAALEYLQSNKVDVLLTDVKMPFMDGLALITEARKLYPELKTVIFSGHSEFEYARTAMKLGVYDYILKPVDPSDFCRTMDKILVEMEAEKEKEEFLIEHFLLLLLNGTPIETVASKAEGFFSLSNLSKYERMVMLEFKSDFFDTVGLEFVDRLKDELQVSFQYLNLDEQQSILIFTGQVSLDYKILGEHIYTFIKNQYKRECYVAVSNRWQGMESILTTYNTLEALLENKFYEKEGFLFVEGEAVDGNLQGEADEKLTKWIGEDIQNKDIPALWNHFERLAGNYQGKKDFSQVYVKFIFSNIIKEIFSELSEGDENQLKEEINLLYRSNDIFDVISITKANIERLEEQLSKNEKSLRGEVETIKKYIHENYHRDISIESLAEQVCLVPSYVSFVFKKETGQNLSKYIKAYRMERAKRMLRDTHEKIVNISQAVGYSNVSYFCQSFREYFGVSPERYRKSGETAGYEKDNTVL